MRNIFWLRPGIICGRTGPDLEVWEPETLAANGIGGVLSVNHGEAVHPGELEAIGLDYACIPLSDNAPPKSGDLEICLDALPRALEFVLETSESGRAVLVHCTGGKDRTALFLSYYLRMTEGRSSREAMSEVKRIRPIAFTAVAYEAFALEVLQVAGEGVVDSSSEYHA